MNDITVIPPYEQAYLLNAKLIARGDTLRDPVITIGGQAVQYWVSYYREQYRDALPDARHVTSIDVDYSARRHDIAAIAQALGVDAIFNDGLPPSLARFALVDSQTHRIQEVDGRYFADPEHPDQPNTVDIIDFPLGFDYRDLSGSLLGLNTELFMIEPDGPDFPALHPMVRVLNPLACLRSRFSNLLSLPRPTVTEVARIKAMMVACVYFIIEKFEQITDPADDDENNPVTFREVRIYLDEFLRFAVKPEIIRAQVEHDLPLYRIPEQLAAVFAADPEGYWVPENLWKEELPRKAEHIRKYAERIERDMARRAREKRPQ